MGENSNAEMIAKLEELEQLLNENVDLNEYIENECPMEYANKATECMLGAEALEGRPELFDRFPVFPPDPTPMLSSKKEYESQKRLFLIIGAVSVGCLVLFFSTSEQFWNTVASAGILASIFAGIVQNSKKKTYLKNQKTYEEELQKSNTSIAAFRRALAVYEEQKNNGILSAKEFTNDYASSYVKYEEVLNEYTEHKMESIDLFLANMEKIRTYDFMPDDYYHLIRPIIVALKSGRADSYKEALNLAIQEEREERAEAARREEDARRTRILQEQAEEERRRTAEMERHNREMEQQQQLQQKMMMDEQRRQAKVQEAQQRDAMLADMEARKNASMRCNKCAKHDACGRNRGIPNCGAFEPKRY